MHDFADPIRGVSDPVYAALWQAWVLRSINSCFPVPIEFFQTILFILLERTRRKAKVIPDPVKLSFQN